MRILLDTNVWTYLVDANRLTWLRRTAREKKITVLVSPAVVFEQLRNPDGVRRAQLVEATTRQVWTRMMPEVWKMCEEFVVVVSRRKSEWLQTAPSPETLKIRQENLRDWQAHKGGFWDRARKDPHRQAKLNEDAAFMRWHEIQDGVQARAAALKSNGLTPDTVQLDDVFISEVEVALNVGENGARLGTWAVEAADLLLTRWIRYRHGTYTDWLDAQVDRKKIRESEWLDFWKIISPAEMPTSWLAWAGSVVASVGRVNSGSPVDIQLVTYLADVDVFITADKKLARVVDTVGRFAPFQIARQGLVRPDHLQSDLEGLISS